MNKTLVSESMSKDMVGKNKQKKGVVHGLNSDLLPFAPFQFAA
jgi:hypothetical protein